jgi:hypothetical protein
MCAKYLQFVSRRATVCLSARSADETGLKVKDVYLAARYGAIWIGLLRPHGLSVEGFIYGTHIYYFTKKHTHVRSAHKPLSSLTGGISPVYEPLRPYGTPPLLEEEWRPNTPCGHTRRQTMRHMRG